MGFFFLVILKCMFTSQMSRIRALVHAVPGVLPCVTSHCCASRRLVTKPLQVFALWLCSPCFGLFLLSCSHSLHVFHTHCCSCCNEHFPDWAQKSVWWWTKGRYWKIFSLLLSWGCGLEVTARDYIILPLRLFFSVVPRNSPISVARLFNN